MESDLIDRIRQHILDVQQRPIVFPTVTADEIDNAERRLGFSIPILLRRLYLEVGNGGFGPGRGGKFIGVSGGHLSSAGDIVETYADVRAGAAFLGLSWPDRLLPFCEWGCAIFSCVDCDDPTSKVYVARDCDPVAQGLSLEQFLRNWINGLDLLP